AFLCVVYVLYWAVSAWTARKVLLLFASYVFYGAWNPFFVVLLMATTGFDWFAGRLLERTATPGGRKALLIASIAINLSALRSFATTTSRPSAMRPSAGSIPPWAAASRCS